LAFYDVFCRFLQGKIRGADAAPEKGRLRPGGIAGMQCAGIFTSGKRRKRRKKDEHVH